LINKNIRGFYYKFRNILPLKDLVNNKTVKAYPPLCEEKGKYVA